METVSDKSADSSGFGLKSPEKKRTLAKKSLHYLNFNIIISTPNLAESYF